MTSEAPEPATAVPPPLVALSEAELTAGWGDAAEEPWVSVCCIAFNHVGTVADAIESILAQRTTFPFELLVHDDASTDGTADVVASYARSHPRVVRAILRPENLYSKNGKTLGNVLPLARGRWVAVCEADDYWSDPGKLAAQVEALRRTGAELSLHSAVEVDARNGAAFVAGRLASDDALLAAGATLVERTPPYAAALYARAALDRFESFRDEYAPPLGDVFMMAYGSLAAGIAYLDRPMSVYRRHLAGSWTSEHMSDDAKAARHAVRMIACLRGLAADAPALRPQVRVRRRRVWWGLVWSLRRAIASGQLSRSEASRIWPAHDRAPVRIALTRYAVLLLPAKASAVLRERLRALAALRR